MKKLILTSLIFGTLSISCYGQEERIETKLMNCFYENYEDQGIEFKNAISDFEKLLISEKILNDSTGKSYVAVFEKIVSDNDFRFIPTKSFLDMIIDIGLPNKEPLKVCQSEILKSSKNEINKVTELQTVLDSIKISGNFSPSTIANGILSVLNEKDFELDYYKMSVFSLFDTISYSTEDGINRKLPELKEDGTEYDLSKALNIYFKGKSQIFVDDKLVTIEELKKLIRAYESKNKSESIISLKNDSETMYKTYIEVQNIIFGEIRSLREQFSKEKYNMELDNLTDEQLTEVKKIYPQKIIE
jgi:biopolymer transport protein ExbD